jgi:hypothetical protein
MIHYTIVVLSTQKSKKIGKPSAHNSALEKGRGANSIKINGLAC